MSAFKNLHIYIVVITIAWFQTIIAQPEKAGYFKLGANFNNQLNAKFSTENLQPGGFVAGGLVVMGEVFGSGLEASYIQKSANWSFDSTTVLDHNNYVEIGVSVRAGKKIGSSRISLTGGMLLSFWQSARRYINSGNTEGKGNIDYASARSALDVGMYLGLEYAWKQLFLEVRTHQGLINIANEDYDLTPIYNQGISVGLGYRFNID